MRPEITYSLACDSNLSMNWLMSDIQQVQQWWAFSLWPILLYLVLTGDFACPCLLLSIFAD